MEQKIQELQAQVVTLEKTLAEIKLVLHSFAERETETKDQADYKYSKDSEIRSRKFWRRPC